MLVLYAHLLQHRRAFSQLHIDDLTATTDVVSQCVSAVEQGCGPEAAAVVYGTSTRV
jgi:hypothetical protein